MKKLYQVSRSYTTIEYIEVEANSENEAIELAKLSDDSDWEEDQMQEYKDYDYNAELV